jgi:enoyl-CoA hydratase/carnithine racemase
MPVKATIEGTVAKVVLNRPEKLNALTLDMRQSLCDYFAQLRFDDNVRAVIVTGAGRGFCSGADSIRWPDSRTICAPTASACSVAATLHSCPPFDRKADDRRGARAGGRHRLEHRARVRPRGGLKDRPLLADFSDVLVWPPARSGF